MTNLFITVPEVTLPCGRFVPSFKVGKFLCSRGPAGLVQVTAEGTPWVSISFAAAKQACAQIGASLITETQALSIAYQVAACDKNWTGGKVGVGRLYQGLRKWKVRSAQPGTYQPQDADERRWFVLPNGEQIFDVAGNAYTWVFDDVQGDERGIVAKPFAKDSPSITIPFPGEQRGQGWTPAAGDNWSGCALIRGGFWYSEARAGVFSLGDGEPGNRYDLGGFRCTL